MSNVTTDHDPADEVTPKTIKAALEINEYFPPARTNVNGIDVVLYEQTPDYRQMREDAFAALTSGLVFFIAGGR